MQTSGYYDYAPTVQIERPVALISFLSSETRAIGYRVSALAGLRFVDLDRLIEHQAGIDVARLVGEEGESGYRARERATLAAALREQPPAVISLGDGTLIDRASRELVTQNATLIGFDLDLANCLWRVREYEQRLRLESNREAAARGGPVEVAVRPWHPLFGSIRDLDDLRPYYQQRRPGIDAAHRRLAARGQSVERLADQVLEILESD